jgi:asparagine synthase (glutamine-hydrolysing)
MLSLRVGGLGDVMCGIAGIYNLRGEDRLPQFNPHAVLDSIRHRGPDDEGIFREGGVFLGARRLAIIDPARGHQPVANETGQIHLVMNGEIFDYDLLLADLQGRGHRFHSHCDTEVLVHLLEERWADVFDQIDGQYALAAYDGRDRKLLLARDRMGICPLFYAVVGDYLVFGSEMKAIFATGLIEPRIDPRSLDAVTAFGCVPAPRAMFQGVQSLRPGELLEVRNGQISRRIYWDIPYSDAGDYANHSIEHQAEEFREILAAASRRRLKADVPVGLYLSGGIDSSAIAALALDHNNGSTEAFSIAFPEPGFDESSRTRRVADSLGLRTHMLTYRQSELARDIPRTVYHGEVPLISTESVPLMALSARARERVKVVLTGEGADEALGGYLYFRWEALNAATATSLPARLLRWVAGRVLHRSLGRRNPFTPQPHDVRWAQQVFGCYPAIMMKFFYFRMLRDLVYSDDMLRRQQSHSDEELVDLPRADMARWDQYSRTLYLSSRIFMTSHLLGSHGDRALMANSVEGRYPFLDRQVQEFLGRVRPDYKTRWYREKILLRRAMAGRLPGEVLRRQKKPFLAPFGTPFVGDDATEYIRHLLAPATIAKFGYFDPEKVAKVSQYLLGQKQAVAEDRGESMRSSRAATERVVSGMALTLVVTTQMLEDQVRSGKFGGAAAGVAVPALAEAATIN